MPANPSYPVRVSIILPTYNHAQYLPQALQSIFSQTFRDFELIVVNDGSTDNTAAVLAKFNDARLRVITQDNQGLPAALNRGFAEARGEFWTWTSADNTVAPAWLEELVRALDESPPDVGYALSYYANINDKGQIISVERNQCFETHSMLARNGNASFLYRSDIAKATGLYDTALTGAEDLDMWVRMSLLTRAVHVESILYYYRLHDDSMTVQIPKKILNASRGLVEKFIASYGGKLDVDRIFPGIADSPDPALARWQAKVWLAERLAGTQFCPVGAIAEMLIEALREKYEPALVGNIVLLFVNADAWQPAADVVAAVLNRDQSKYMRNLADMLVRQDVEALKKIPYTSIAEGDLIFDRKGQLSRAKLAA